MSGAKLEVEKLKAEVERLKKELKKRKKYGLVWEEKPEEVVEMCKEKLPVLKEVKNKEIITNKDKPVNLLIEGDNYHALSVLNYTHAGKIDVIYIDPPYNTGSRSWKFNNNYVDQEDAYRHSKWVSFMYVRLKLSRALLKEDGVIIVTIDDYEVPTLRLILDEIFGEKNRLATVVVESNPRGRTSDKFVAICHEYMLLYSRSASLAKTYKMDLTEEQKSLFKLKDKISQYRLLPFRKSGADSRKKDRPKQFYPIFLNPTTLKLSLKKKNRDWIELLPIDSQGNERVWRLGKIACQKAIDNGDLVIIKKKGDLFTLNLKDRIKEGRMAKSIWVGPKYDSSAHGSILISEILNKLKPFEYPKSLYAVLNTLKLTVKEKRDAIVLDFFAGSGTTGHAVLELNEEDGGNRQFILCTDNENNICTDVCYPRIKKVIEGYKNLKGQKVKGLGGNLKYFKTDFVEAEPTDKNKIKLTQQSTEMLCIKEGTFEKVLDQRKFKIFKNNNHYTGIIFDQLAIPTFKKAIKGIKGRFSVYVFSLSDETFDEEFADIKQKVKLSPIPEAILRVYRRIFK